MQTGNKKYFLCGRPLGMLREGLKDRLNATGLDGSGESRDRAQRM